MVVGSQEVGVRVPGGGGQSGGGWRVLGGDGQSGGG